MEEGYPALKSPNGGNKGWNAVGIDVYHPYYLHPSDNASISLTSVVLTGVENYLPWSRTMRMALLTKNKLGFIDGSLKPPSEEDPKLLVIWKQVNAVVITWLMKCVSDSIAQSVAYFDSDSALSVWKELEERFSQSDIFRMSDLLSELHSLKQGTMSVTSYYTKIKTLLYEYNILRPIPCCQYRGVKVDDCKVRAAIRDYHNTDFVLCFLKGLSDCYMQTRSQILLMEPLPSINTVYNMVVQHEFRITEKVVVSLPQAGVFANQSVQAKPGSQAVSGAKPGAWRRGRKPMLCTKCGGTNRTVDRCFQIYGFPPGYQIPPSQQHTVSSNNVSRDYVLDQPRDMDVAAPTSLPTGGLSSQLNEQQMMLLFQVLQKEEKHAGLSPAVNALTTHFAGQTQMSGPEEAEDDWFC